MSAEAGQNGENKRARSQPDILSSHSDEPSSQLDEPSSQPDVSSSQPDVSSSQPDVPSSPDVPQKKKQRCRMISLNPLYTCDDFKSPFKRALQNEKDFSFGNGAMVISKPFAHCILPDLISSEEDVDELRNVVSNLIFKEKRNDLYQFSQSYDFKKEKHPMLTCVKNFFYRTFRLWISEVLGYALEDEVDLSASCYDESDYLLCHNDQWGTRKVAFIYYLVTDWGPDDGGTLDFFDTCGDIPQDIVSSVVPKLNRFVFFEVTPYSYHQVSEIVSQKSRFALSGWYHAEPSDRISHLALELKTSLPGVFSGSLTDFINPFYLNDENIVALQAQFEDSSEAQLHSFLIPAMYKSVAKELRECSTWTAVGPPHKRSYEELGVCSLPAYTRRLHHFLQSDVFLNLLSSLSGVKLFEQSSYKTSVEPSVSMPSSSGTVSAVSAKSPAVKGSDFNFDVCRFSHRSYTVVCDEFGRDPENALDIILFFNCQEWDDTAGGKIIYFSNDSDESLVEISPVENSMCLIYREKDVMKFTRYLNNTVNQRTVPFYNCISSTFYDNEDDCN